MNEPESMLSPTEFARLFRTMHELPDEQAKEFETKVSRFLTYVRQQIETGDYKGAMQSLSQITNEQDLHAVISQINNDSSNGISSIDNLQHTLGD